MLTLNDSVLAEILINDVIETLDELVKDEKDDFNNGQRLALTHILRVIKGQVDSDELKDIGLDFDVDKKYL